MLREGHVNIHITGIAGPNDKQDDSPGPVCSLTIAFILSASQFDAHESTYSGLNNY